MRSVPVVAAMTFLLIFNSANGDSGGSQGSGSDYTLEGTGTYHDPYIANWAPLGITVVLGESSNSNTGGFVLNNTQVTTYQYSASAKNYREVSLQSILISKDGVTDFQSQDTSWLAQDSLYEYICNGVENRAVTTDAGFLPGVIPAFPQGRNAIIRSRTITQEVVVDTDFYVFPTDRIWLKGRDYTWDSWDQHFAGGQTVNPFSGFDFHVGYENPNTSGSNGVDTFTANDYWVTPAPQGGSGIPIQHQYTYESGDPIRDPVMILDALDLSSSPVCMYFMEEYGVDLNSLLGY